MEPIIAKHDDGWKCRRCRREPESFPDAVLHASVDHGADVAWNAKGDIFDARNPDVLRQGGII